MEARNLVIAAAAVALVALLLIGLVAGLWLWSSVSHAYRYGMMDGFGFPWRMHDAGRVGAFDGVRTWLSYPGACHW